MGGLSKLSSYRVTDGPQETKLCTQRQRKGAVLHSRNNHKRMAPKRTRLLTWRKGKGAVQTLSSYRLTDGPQETKLCTQRQRKGAVLHSRNNHKRMAPKWTRLLTWRKGKGAIQTLSSYRVTDGLQVMHTSRHSHLSRNIGDNKYMIETRYCIFCDTYKRMH